MTRIKLIYNHITGISRIFINDKPILKQTALDHFLQAPFVYWFQSLLSTLYREVMDSYTLEFVARPLECRLLQLQKESCPQCQRLTFTKLPFDMTTAERLRRLAQLNPNLNPAQSCVNVYTDEDNGELNELQLTGASQYPLCNITCSLRSVQDSEEARMWDGDNQTVRFVFLYHTPFSSPFLQYLNGLGGRNYVFYANAAGASDTAWGQTYCSSFEPGNALKTYQKWLDYEILPSVLRQKLSETQRSPESMDGLKLCVLDQVDGRRFLIPRKWIPLGERVRFDSRGFPEQYPDDFEYESSNPDIISVENGMLVGVRPGSCYIDVYEPGFSRPLYHLNLRCCVMVRELKFAENVIQLTCGDQLTLPLLITPQNSENKDEIVFGSSDESILSVDPKTGRAVANASGEATVYASLGEIHTRCLVQVRSKLEAIQIESSKLVIKENATAQISVKPFPSDALLGDYELTAEGDGLVQISQGEGIITGISKGNVTLVARSKNGAQGQTGITVKKPLNPNIFIGIGAVCASIILLTFVFHLLFG